MVRICKRMYNIFQRCVAMVFRRLLRDQYSFIDSRFRILNIHIDLSVFLYGRYIFLTVHDDRHSGPVSHAACSLHKRGIMQEKSGHAVFKPEAVSHVGFLNLGCILFRSLSCISRLLIRFFRLFDLRITCDEAENDQHDNR